MGSKIVRKRQLLVRLVIWPHSAARSSSSGVAVGVMTVKEPTPGILVEAGEGLTMLLVRGCVVTRGEVRVVGELSPAAPPVVVPAAPVSGLMIEFVRTGIDGTAVAGGGN